MSGFIERLVERSKKDTKIRAVLRRSLAFDPGTYSEAFPYVESFTINADEWNRSMFYLVAGLWSEHWKQASVDQPMSIGAASALYMSKPGGSQSIERRFINLLDSDEEQLPVRLRQIVSLLKDYNIDFEDLLAGLLRWQNERKITQSKWARDFYRHLTSAAGTEIESEEENK